MRTQIELGYSRKGLGRFNERSGSALVSSKPKDNNEGKPANQQTQKQTTATPAIIETVSTDEVVDTVNKFGENLLDESPQQSVSTSIKDYTPPEKVVEIVLDLTKRKRTYSKWTPKSRKKMRNG